MAHVGGSLLALLLLALTASAPPGPQAGADAVEFVVTSRAAPFLEAARAARTRLHRHGYRVGHPIFVGDEGATLPKGTGFFITFGTAATRWTLERAPAAARVAYCMVSDPDGAHFDEDPRAYGISTSTSYATQLRLGREMVPRFRALSVLYRRSSAASRLEVERLRAAAGKQYVVHAVDMDAYDTSARAIDALFAQRVDFVWTFPDKTIYDLPVTRALLLASVRRRVPCFGYSPSFVRSGAAVGVGVEEARQGERVADLAMQLIGAARDPRVALPQLRVLEPDLQIAVNVQTCAVHGLDVPKAWKPYISWTFGGR